MLRPRPWSQWYHGHQGCRGRTAQSSVHPGRRRCEPNSVSGKTFQLELAASTAVLCSCRPSSNVITLEIHGRLLRKYESHCEAKRWTGKSSSPSHSLDAARCIYEVRRPCSLFPSLSFMIHPLACLVGGSSHDAGRPIPSSLSLACLFSKATSSNS